MNFSPAWIGTPDRGPDVGLHLHHAVELGEAPAFGMVRVDGVDRRALLAQPVGEQHLAGFMSMPPMMVVTSVSGSPT